MPRFRRQWIYAVLVIVNLFWASGRAEAQYQALDWKRWDVEFQINSDGSVSVSEVYEIDFISGVFTKGFTNIVKNQFTDLTDVSVREPGQVYSESRSQEPFTFFSEFSDGEYVIRWFFPALENETRTFVVSYRLEGALIIDESGEIGDRFFWKAVRSDRPAAVAESRIFVRVPEGAQITLAEGFGTSNLTWQLVNNDGAAEFIDSAIPVGSEVEVGVRWPTGFVPSVKPPWQAAYEIEQRAQDLEPVLNLVVGAGSLLLAVVCSIGLYSLWLLRGRDPKTGPIPETLSEPPSNLPPGLVGTLVDERADLQDIIATLIDLGRRGAVIMQEGDKPLFGKQEFTYYRVQEFNEPLRPYEQKLLSNVFSRKDRVELSDLQERFYSHIPGLQDELYKEAVKEGLFPRSPKTVRGQWIALGVLGIVASIGGWCAVMAIVPSAWWFVGLTCPFLVIGGVSLALIGVANLMPAKTALGAEETAKWRAFRAFLQNAERFADLKQMTDKFDAYLPYAVAFGLEKSWVNKFTRIQTTPVPGWYFPVGHQYRPGIPVGGQRSIATGSGDLGGQTVGGKPSLDSMSGGLSGGLASMSAGLTTMLNSTARTFTSAPSSSGSSGGGGFSGGGFSGGGGGGGGGAGFG